MSVYLMPYLSLESLQVQFLISFWEILYWFLFIIRSSGIHSQKQTRKEVIVSMLLILLTKKPRDYFQARSSPTNKDPSIKSAF